MSRPFPARRWPAPTVTAALWALAAASLVFWGLRLAAPSDAIAPPALAPAPAVADPAAVARLLGAVVTERTVSATPDAATRFALQGVIADSDGQGAALIVVDGKPARPFRVGAVVADGYVLQSVDTRAAKLGASVAGATAFSLQLPVRPFAANPPPAPR